MAIEIFNRQELKFVITAEQYDCIIQGIMPYVQADKHNNNGQIYRIYNLYIDTIDSALIRHSISKPVTYKEKLRIRSYVDFNQNPVVFLETKKRYKRITNKRRTRIPYDEALTFITSGALPSKHEYMNMQVVREIESMLTRKSYYPKVFITYDRLAFTSQEETESLRITFDTNIISRRYNQTTELNLLDDGRVIMELKSSYNVPLWLVELLSSCGVRKQGFSKYGQEYLHYLRSNKLNTTGGTYA